MRRASCISLSIPFVVLALAGCASQGSHRVVTPATDAQRSALFGMVADLEGDWEMVDDAGNRHLAAIIRVSSAGSVVREVMFPGSEHEMTNVYHMDGPSLVMTHYCAQGNQPRMRAWRAASPTRIDFAPDGVTNLTSADDIYMCRMTLERTGPDAMRQSWSSCRNGRLHPTHTPSFDLVRRR
jgi:hypothetical protein